MNNKITISQETNTVSNAERLQDLIRQENEAVSQRNYLKAEEIKNQIYILEKSMKQERLEGKNKQLETLRLQEQEAVSKRDFITAQRIKEQMDEIEKEL